MAKFATLNDTHFGVKNDAPYMLDYQEKFYSEVFFPTLEKEGIVHVLHGGDLFDRRKYINFGTLNRTRKMFLDPLRERAIHMDIIPGNHDVLHKNTNEINSLRELLAGYENINIVEHPTHLKFYKQVLLPREDRGFGISHESILEKKLLLLPWMNVENYAKFMEFVDHSDADILYGHLELAGFQMYAGVPNAHGMDASLFAKFKRVWSGHFHHQSREGNIHYLGAPMEYTLSDCEDRRGFHIYDTETDNLQFIQNPFVLHQKVYYNDETEKDTLVNTDFSKFENQIVKVFVTKKTDSKFFEAWIEKFYKVNTIDLTIMENYTEFSNQTDVEIDVADYSTRDLMDKYVETAETSMDKTRLKNILGNLYTEALHSDNL